MNDADADLELRNLTYRMFVELGRAPTIEEVSAAAGIDVGDVRAGWSRLHQSHALVLQPHEPAIRMANPFSGLPTAYRVRAAGRWWYANCAWDALGICAALHTEGHVETSCPDCGERLDVDVLDGSASREPWLFHALVPASRWWDDIGFT